MADEHEKAASDRHRHKAKPKHIETVATGLSGNLGKRQIAVDALHPSSCMLDQPGDYLASRI
jgi:hypothetical protein